MSNHIASCFFAKKELRMYRHLSLLLSIAVFTVSFLWYIPVVNVPIYYKVYAWVIYWLFYSGIIYHNLYVAVPAFLLKNKVLKYILLLMGYTIMAMSLILIVQYGLLKVEPDGDNDRQRMVINVVSALFTLCLLFMGTTSLLLIKYRVTSDIEKKELETSILESELKLLENQVNPHFLFNMLNNANMLLKKDSKQASEVLFKLEDLLRYQIHNDIKEEVNLGTEINFLSDYLKLEKIRRDNFDYSISKSGSCEHQKVFPLLFIIFVENAVKHNVDNENPSYVNLSFNSLGDRLEFVCENSKPMQMVKSCKVGGLGLKNIQRRLELLYPERHSLNIKDEKTKYIVKLTLAL